MMIETLEALGYNIEKFERAKSIFPKIESFENTVLFFDLKGDSQLNLLYEKDYEILVDEFKDTGYNFLFLPNLEFPNDVQETIEYFIPHLIEKTDFIVNIAVNSFQANAKDDFSYFSSFERNYKKLLNYFGYRGNINSGYLILSKYEVFVVKYTNEDILDGLEDPRESILSYLNDLKGFDDTISYSPRGRDLQQRREREMLENLDVEVVEKINHINEQIKDLKSSGEWILIIQSLKNTLDRLADEISLDTISIVRIDEEYKITLPHFNNIEVKLSHLTKVIYVFFYNHPEGIMISELNKYENELLELYLSISNQNDLDKMKQSITDLTKEGSNTILTHISRIKSAFYALMDDSIAKHYIIASASHGSDLKFIPHIFTYGEESDEEDESFVF